MRYINPEREVRSYPDSEMRNPIGRGDSPVTSWSSVSFIVDHTDVVESRG